MEINQLEMATYLNEEINQLSKLVMLLSEADKCKIKLILSKHDKFYAILGIKSAPSVAEVTLDSKTIPHLTEYFRTKLLETKTLLAKL